MDDTGLEPPQFSAGNPAIPSAGGAPDAPAAILTDRDAFADNPLRRLLAVWPNLSDDNRHALATRAETLSRGD